MNLRINNSQYDFFTEFNVALRHDSVASQFSFGAYFNPDNADHRKLFRPLSYPKVVVEHERDTLITGTVINHSFLRTAAPELARLAGYSLPGILEDCTIPTSAYPLQSDGLSLRQIAQKLLKPFGIGMVVDAAVAAKVDKKYTVSKADDRQTIKSYLSELAAQRHILLTHDAQGRVVFTEAKANMRPVADYYQESQWTRMSIEINGQALHSDITVQRQASSTNTNAGQSKVTNPLLGAAIRPFVDRQSSNDDVSTAQAARNLLSAELRNIKLTIEQPGWYLGDLLAKPNNIITVTNPAVFLYNESKWFIEGVDLIQDASGTQRSILSCVLPEVYNSQAPKNVFA